MNFNDAFGNINEDLENMARNYNNKNKRTYNDVKNYNHNKDKETLRGIEYFENQPGFQFSPSHIKDKGDFKSGLPSHLEDNSCSESYGESQINSLGDSFSLDGKKSEHFVSMSMSDENYSDSDVISEYSYLPKNKKKKLRMKSKHLQKYEENDEELILDHIKKCDQCKHHLLTLLKNDNHFVNKENDKIIQKSFINDIKEENETGFFGKINYKEMKEVIILIIIGIIIIFVLDIFLRR